MGKKGKKKEKKLPPLYFYYTGDKPNQNFSEGNIIAGIDPGVVHFCIRVEERTEKKFIKTHLNIKESLNQDEELFDETKVYYNLITLLDKHKKLFLNCDIISIERQLKQNQPCVRIMQHLITYFTILFNGTTCLLCDICPKFKYRSLGAPKEVKGYELKNKWGPNKALEICEKRGDKSSMATIRGVSKKNDYADVIIICEATYQYLKN